MMICNSLEMSFKLLRCFHIFILSQQYSSVNKNKTFGHSQECPNVLFWSGFVSPELCEEDIFLRYPAIEFKTIDGLGALKNKSLTENAKYPDGILSLLKVVQGALNTIGYGYGLNVLCKLFNLNYNKTDYSTPLEQTYIYTAGIQDKNFDFKNNSGNCANNT